MFGGGEGILTGQTVTRLTKSGCPSIPAVPTLQAIGTEATRSFREHSISAHVPIPHLEGEGPQGLTLRHLLGEKEGAAPNRPPRHGSLLRLID